jgi:hypothetical protein
LWSAVPDRPREKGKKLILKGSQKKKKKKIINDLVSPLEHLMQ